MAARIPQSSAAVMLRLSLGCDFCQVQPARLAVRGFLKAQGLQERELIACELALVEACNNAIQYVSQAGRHQPIRVNVRCYGWKVELRVDDHTAGFDWPQQAKLPTPDRESGRGLFVIQFLMDRADYLRGRGENRLIMRKRRFGQSSRPGVSPALSGIAPAKFARKTPPAAMWKPAALRNSLVRGPHAFGS